jgi:hypothetical protein
MANPAGESNDGALRLDFDRRLKLEFHGSRITSDGRYVAFQMAEVAILRQIFADILQLIARLRPPPDPAVA